MMPNFTKWFEAIGLRPRREVTPPGEIGLYRPENLLTRSEAHPGFVATVSGRLFDIVNPDPSEIDIDEMAHALSQINRFCGHTQYPYSVAQHSVLCAKECERRYPCRPELALALLLHDGAEYVCCDIIRPLKRMIGSLYRPIEDRVQEAVWKRFGLRVGHSAQAIIHECDNAVVMTESRALMRGSERWNWADTQPSPLKITRMSAYQAERWFLETFKELDARRLEYAPIRKEPSTSFASLALT
jgi:uncharacterized protein